jgi:hypothetical protein
MNVEKWCYIGDDIDRKGGSNGDKPRIGSHCYREIMMRLWVGVVEAFGEGSRVNPTGYSYGSGRPAETT